MSYNVTSSDKGYLHAPNTDFVSLCGVGWSLGLQKRQVWRGGGGGGTGRRRRGGGGAGPGEGGGGGRDRKKEGRGGMRGRRGARLEEGVWGPSVQHDTWQMGKTWEVEGSDESPWVGGGGGAAWRLPQNT